MTDRPTWDQYFIGLVEEIARRATCDRGRCGCLMIKDKRIICTGYVGSPPGFPHCDEVGHLKRKVIDEDGVTRQHCVRTIHAEQNAICQAAKNGISLAGATCYCSMEPCRTCAVLLVSVGVERVVAKRRYHAGQDTREILEHAGIELVVFEDAVESYDDQ